MLAFARPDLTDKSSVKPRLTDRKISILVANDHLLVRSGLRQLIETDAKFSIVAACSDGEEALAAIRRHLPDIAVLDLKMPKRDGLGILRAIKAEGLLTKVLLLTGMITDSEIDAAVKQGASGVLLKEWAAESLLHRLHSIAVGIQAAGRLGE